MAKADGAGRPRSSPLNAAFMTLIERARVESGSDIALVVRAERQAQDPGADRMLATVLAGTSASAVHRFMPNEPVHIAPAVPDFASPLPELTLRSAIRPFQVTCGFSLGVPWRSGVTRGWLIVGNCNSAHPPHVTHDVARRYSRLLRQTYLDAGLRSTNKLQHNLACAVRALGEFEAEVETLDELLPSVLTVGRRLLGTSACYLSLPTSDPDIFSFARLLGVRTGPFKRLRMRAGQGLGGLARHERRVVRSLNYAQDFHERDAPVHETAQEGLQSAMCTPLVADGKIMGLLYAANRTLTPFSDSDGRLLEEFAGNVALMFRRAQWERLRRSAVRRQERDRLARDLHDTVVRKLLEIGQETRMARGCEAVPGAHGHLAAIEGAAQACLDAIRGHLGELTSELDLSRQARVGDVLDLLAAPGGVAASTMRSMSRRAASGAICTRRWWRRWCGSDAKHCKTPNCIRTARRSTCRSWLPTATWS